MKFIVIFEKEDKLETLFFENEFDFNLCINELIETKTKYSYFIIH